MLCHAPHTLAEIGSLSATARFSLNLDARCFVDRPGHHLAIYAF